MFSRKKKESLPLQLYGKLPLAKDYLRVGASSDAGRAFRDWMDQTYSTSAREGERRSLAFSARYLLCARKGDVLMGSVWSSADAGNERKFPFTLFVERARKPLRSALKVGFESQTSVWEAIEAMYHRIPDFDEGNALIRTVREQTVEIPPSEDPQPERIGWTSWTNALWNEEGKDGLLKTLTSLRALATAGHRGPIRLPLVNDRAALPQVHAWWTALVAFEHYGEEDIPTVLFPGPGLAADEPAFATFLHGESLRLEDAQWFGSARSGERLGMAITSAEVAPARSARTPRPKVAEAWRNRCAEPLRPRALSPNAILQGLAILGFSSPKTRFLAFDPPGVLPSPFRGRMYAPLAA